MGPFDEELKHKHREREALQCDRSGWGGIVAARDPLRDEVLERLLDRLDDVKGRSFPRALDVGFGEGAVRALLRGRGGIKDLVECTSGPIQRTESAIEIVKRRDTRSLGEGQFDLVIANLCLHWTNDPLREVKEWKRILKDDGYFLCSIFAGETLRELRIALALAEAERTGGRAQRVSPLMRLRETGMLPSSAGMALSAADIDTFVLRYPSAAHLIDHIRRIGESSALHENIRPPPMRPDTALAAIAIYDALFPWSDREESMLEPDEEGGVYATFQVSYMTGWKPGEGQPQPMSRGSATRSLSDI